VEGTGLNIYLTNCIIGFAIIKPRTTINAYIPKNTMVLAISFELIQVDISELMGTTFNLAAMIAGTNDKQK
jgi:hypothetical protein